MSSFIVHALVQTNQLELNRVRVRERRVARGRLGAMKGRTVVELFLSCQEQVEDLIDDWPGGLFRGKM